LTAASGGAGAAAASARSTAPRDRRAGIGWLVGAARPSTDDAATLAGGVLAADFPSPRAVPPLAAPGTRTAVGVGTITAAGAGRAVSVMVRFAAPAAAARAPESATRRGPAGRDFAPPGERLDEVAAVPPADAASPAEDLAEEEGPAAVDVSSAWAAPAPASASPTPSAPAPSHA